MSASPSSPVFPSDYTNLGKWDGGYATLKPGQEVEFYGDTLTYRMAASFLADVDAVEDWGCGKGGFRHFYQGRYTGIDGSHTPFADTIADLCTYTSKAEAIVMRHVLEHDYRWEEILRNAVRSFERKFCLILFTDFAPETTEIGHNRSIGCDVPDLSLPQAAIERHFAGLDYRLVRGLSTKTQYKVEHVYFVWRPKRKLFSLIDRYVPRYSTWGPGRRR